MLVRAGMPPQSVASGVAASWAATTAAVLALPAIAVVAGIGGTVVPDPGLRNVAYLGAAAFVVMTAVGAAAFLRDRPLRLVGRATQAAAGLVGRRERLERLPERLLSQRDDLRRAFSSHPWLALLAALGRWGFDYLALLCVPRRPPSSRSRRSSCSHSRRHHSSA